ncbi:MAG: helix-turn-helix transcriptional regulator, partial [Anaerolineaceae bacterium]
MADGTDFGRVLREFRARAGQTQQQLAEHSGLSVSAIQSYEIGRRQPDSAAVERLKKPLGLENGDYARLRGSAGLSAPQTGLTAAWLKARGAPNTVWEEVQGCDWISMVMNERKEIVAWNRLANRVGELDLATLSQFQRSILRMAATEHFDRHLLNWEELIGRLISMIKGEGSDISAGPPAQYIQSVIESVAAEDPRFLTRIFDLYATVPIWPDAARNVHPIRWRLDDGTELAFHGAFGDWSNYDGLWSFDWHAADATTARWVQEALAEDAVDVTPPDLRPFKDEVGRARADARMSRAELARRSGLAVATISAYEHGRRTPSRPALLALCRALTLDGYATNRFMREAGFDEEPSDFARWMSGEEPIAAYKGMIPIHAASTAAIFDEADSLEWPCVVLDAACHVVHANPHASRLVDLTRWEQIPGRPGTHLMQLMVSRQFREQVMNWETVAGVILPGRLESQVLGNPGLQSASGVRTVAEHLRKTDADGLGRLLDV